MADFILLDGDTVLFHNAFGAAMVMAPTARIRASGGGPEASQPAQLVNGRRCCVEGDEATVRLAGVTYMAGAYAIPGSGTLWISTLAPQQVARETKLDGKRVLLNANGYFFDATFEVNLPAKMPPPGPGSPIPDPVPRYLGKGYFVTGNTTRQGA